MPYVYGGYTLYAGPFKPFDFSIGFLLPAGSAAPAECSHNPIQATPAGYCAKQVWPVPISLATTLGITIVFSSCGY